MENDQVARTHDSTDDGNSLSLERTAREDGASLERTTREDGETYASQYAEVQAWLAEMYGPAAPPGWEITPQNIEALHRLMMRNRLRDTELSARIRLARESSAHHSAALRKLRTRCALLQCSAPDDSGAAEEHRSAAAPSSSSVSDRPPSKLSSASIASWASASTDTQQQAAVSLASSAPGFSTELLSHRGRASARALASLAVSLELDSPQQSGLVVGLLDKTDEEKRVADRLAEEQARERNFALLLARSQQQLHSLQALRSELENSWRQQERTMQTQTRTLGYLNSKSREYDSSLNTMKTQLQQSGVRPELYHDHLVSVSSTTAKVIHETQQLQRILESYGDLPPDISLAQLKVREAEERLAQLDKEIADQIASISL
mmetsp:Transcript_12220/g.36992  ORF Transcript_12220/g.36992 Transcript_12220/m.36992 type:complete len:378 (-) Transcript_12220:36-1169(-)